MSGPSSRHICYRGSRRSTGPRRHNLVAGREGNQELADVGVTVEDAHSETARQGLPVPERHGPPVETMEFVAADSFAWVVADVCAAGVGTAQPGGWPPTTLEVGAGRLHLHATQSSNSHRDTNLIYFPQRGGNDG